MNERQPSSSSRSYLVKKLTAYSAALGAGLAACDQAHAEVAYTDLGPNGITIQRGEYNIDLNGDSLTDFALLHRSAFEYSSISDLRISQSDALRPVAQNRVILKPSNPRARLPESYPISPDAINATGMQVKLFSKLCIRSSYQQRSQECGAFGGGGSFGTGRGYLGLVFRIASTGDFHAGWADLEVIAPWTTFPPFHTGRTRMYAFAYETEPGKPILAGDTGASEQVLGDTNADGQVDIADLNNVRNNFGTAGDSVLGDTNDDDVVDIQDLNAVRNNFGAGNPVPEPSSLVLLAAGAAGLAMLRGKRKRHDQV